MARYHEEGLLPEGAFLADADFDIDLNNVVASTLLHAKRDAALVGSSSDLDAALAEVVADHADLFFFADSSGGVLYFELLFGSKTDARKKHLKRFLLLKLRNTDCPTCNGKLRIRADVKPTRVNGDVQQCQRYTITCASCHTILARVAFQAKQIIREALLNARDLFASVQRVKGSADGIEIEFDQSKGRPFRC